MKGDFPPSSKLTGVSDSAAARPIRRAVRRRAGEAQPGEVRMRGERRARLLPPALHDVEHPRRQARAGRDVGEHRAGERRPLGGLEHHGVPRRKGRAHLPGAEHQRRVPGRDQRRHPGGLVADVVVGGVAGDDLPSDAAREIGEERDVVRASRHHVLAVAEEQGAVVEGLDGREVLDAGLDALRQSIEDGSAAGRPERGPARKRLARGPHRVVHVAAGARAHLSQKLPVDGREHGESIGRRDPLAADPVPGVHLDAGNTGSVRHPALRRRSLRHPPLRRPPRRCSSVGRISRRRNPT